MQHKGSTNLYHISVARVSCSTTYFWAESGEAVLRCVRIPIMSNFAIPRNIFLSFVTPLLSASFPQHMPQHSIECKRGWVERSKLMSESLIHFDQFCFKFVNILLFRNASIQECCSSSKIAFRANIFRSKSVFVEDAKRTW